MPVPLPDDTTELTDEAQAHYERAQRALRDGDFTLFGEEWKKLGETLNKIKTGKK